LYDKSVAELKCILESKKIDYSACIEKEDLIKLLAQPRLGTGDQNRDNNNNRDKSRNNNNKSKLNTTGDNLSNKKRKNCKENQT
jgi:hypothetical protein